MATYALIDCKCGWRTEREVQNEKRAECIANEHESRDTRRPYRHDTTITFRRDK